MDKIVAEGITFDDVLLLPGRSDFLPREVDTHTRLSRHISINIPLVSSPMDTVTESALAIALAQEGGISIIHKNLSIEAQCREVEKVKRSENGVIQDPVTLGPDEKVSTAREMMAQQNISGVPIVNQGKLVGILTRRDLKFLESFDRRIEEVMTRENLVTGAPDTTLKQAEDILNKHKVEKLLLVNKDGSLAGLITMRDIERMQQFPNASKDRRGRLRVGASVGVLDFERVDKLIAKDVDLIMVDSAHGHSKNVIETVKELRKRWPKLEIVAGNVATGAGARDLIEAGVDGIRVGIGPGSICTTRIVSGVGVPQISAVYEAAQEANKHNIPVIADGGIRHSGDITKAIAAGASSVMLGSLFAGLDESPGETVIYKGRRFKQYRGMGSLGAMVTGGAERYGQSSKQAPGKLVPEGVEGRVPYRGTLAEYVYQLVGGLKAGMGYCGTRDIEALRQNSRFIRVTAASVRESHPHDIAITREAPNYSIGAEPES